MSEAVHPGVPRVQRAEGLEPGLELAIGSALAGPIPGDAWPGMLRLGPAVTVLLWLGSTT